MIHRYATKCIDETKNRAILYDDSRTEKCDFYPIPITSKFYYINVLIWSSFRTFM